jgi:CheY-like chemotaxis protein
MPERAPTVLVVDDDPQILRLVLTVLKHSNLRVLVAPLPSEALRICEVQPIDLLIADMKMPGMDGIRLAGRVLKLHPAASVLLMSGYFHSAPDGAKRIRFLPKPFFPSELLRHLRELFPEA